MAALASARKITSTSTDFLEPSKYKARHSAGFFVSQWQKGIEVTKPDSALSIRAAKSYDFSGLTELYQHLIGDDLPATEEIQAKTFETILRHPGMTILIGCLGDVPVTTCTLIVVPNFTRGCAPYALIENVVTHRDHRGRGYGEQVLKAASDSAWDAGCYKIMLLSGIQNTAAHRFYERIGFSATKQGFELRAPGYPARTLT
ncbi:GNAT family N-acetyltransferase [Labrenzia sp. PHM005]|uniref:GNAT family N-acetyltransferase n=1 Tax=Labrenzia sp. PHM005 TaxID=2590016 RepID=UPI00114072CA|nr:GNAT family N-acetyltransferase [Labrenzia sp. PHM005]QDG77543.1 GNAT family N-acetyltransferase [Labrenzia sp. PHM005]